MYVLSPQEHISECLMRGEKKRLSDESEKNCSHESTGEISQAKMQVVAKTCRPMGLNSMECEMI